MRSMCQVLSKQERLQVASEGGTVEIWVSQFIRQSSKLPAQPRQRHDDHTCSAGTLGRRASCGWLNRDAVIQRLERPACTALTSGQALGREDTCIPSSRACTWPDLPHRASAAQHEGAPCVLDVQLASSTETVLVYMFHPFEMSMIRWMCGVKLNERKKSEELWELLGLEPVSLIKKSRLRWFENVERKDDNDWVKCCITWEVEGIRERGCPKKTWKV